MIRPISRLAAAAVAVALAVPSATPARAVPAVPVSPKNPEVAEQWVNPAVRPGEGQLARVSLIDAPAVVSAHDPFHVKLRVTNQTDTTLEGLKVLTRRAAPVGSVSEQRVAAVAGVGEYSVVGDEVVVDTRLRPGESAELSLQMTAPGGIGVYPMMLQLIDDTSATLDTDRFHLAVRGSADDVEPGGLTALYPVSAPVNIVPGETGEAPEDPPLVLQSDALAEQLAPGGRLDTLVEQYRKAVETPEVGYATCMALDPALVDTVDRMTGGYTVSDSRPAVVEEPKRLRDSWGSNDDTHGTPGSGAEDAKAWLDKVREIAATGCTVALPWANADLNAVARTGDPWLMREAVERGPFVLQRVLGTAGTINTVVAGTGYIEAGAGPALGWADHTRSTVFDGGMHAAWEAAQADSAPDAEANSHQSALERAELADFSGAAAPVPEVPVQVLVAKPADAQRFTWNTAGVMEVGYQDSLAAVLAATGEHPDTPGYSNPGLRFDYTRDSNTARDVNAAAAMRLAAQSATTGEGDAPTQPVMINPPATWDAKTAAVLLGTVAGLIADGTSRPISFGDYLAAPPEVPPADTTATFSDPAAFTDAEILQVTQQNSFINDITALMANDPAIALTRYGFTLPLRRDMLVALSTNRRRALSLYDDAVRATGDRLAASRATLNDLRDSVTLIPPGNVYTRASSSSPLLIVAQNGMPLPVQTQIRYWGPDGAKLNVPGTLKIPARGSVTVQMTADLPDNNRGTDLQLYLAGASAQPISRPVDISVRTAGLQLGGWALAGALIAAMLALLLITRRKAPPNRRPTKRPPPSNPRERRQP